MFPRGYRERGKVMRMRMRMRCILRSQRWLARRGKAEEFLSPLALYMRQNDEPAAGNRRRLMVIGVSFGLRVFWFNRVATTLVDRISSTFSLLLPPLPHFWKVQFLVITCRGSAVRVRNLRRNFCDLQVKQWDFTALYEDEINPL